MPKEGHLLNRIYRFLKIELVVDKLIDFLLVFVGLLAALLLDSHIKQRELTNQYIDDLRNIYSEVYLNQIKWTRATNDFKTGTLFLEYAKNQFENKFPDGVLDNFFIGEYFWITNKHYTDGAFKSLNKDAFRNKNLLAIITNTYTKFYSTDDDILEFINNIRQIGKSNFEEKYQELAYLLVISSSRIVYIKNDIYAVQNQFEHTLKHIKNELLQYGIPIKDVFNNVTDYQSIVAALFANKDFDEALEIAFAGIDKIQKNKSGINAEVIKYSEGALNKLIGMSFYEKKEALKAIDYFQKAIEMEYDKKYCYLYLAGCYNILKDKSQAMKYLLLHLSIGDNNVGAIFKVVPNFEDYPEFKEIIENSLK